MQFKIKKERLNHAECVLCMIGKRGNNVVYLNKLYEEDGFHCPATKELCVQCPRIGERLLTTEACMLPTSEVKKFVEPLDDLRIHIAPRSARDGDTTYQARIKAGTRKHEMHGILYDDKINPVVMSGAPYEAMWLLLDVDVNGRYFLVQPESAVVTIGDPQVTNRKIANQLYYAFVTQNEQPVLKAFDSESTRIQSVRQSLEDEYKLYLCEMEWYPLKVTYPDDDLKCTIHSLVIITFDVSENRGLTVSRANIFPLPHGNLLRITWETVDAKTIKRSFDLTASKIVYRRITIWRATHGVYEYCDEVMVYDYLVPDIII